MKHKLSIFILIFFYCFGAYAANTAYDSKAPIEITSDMLEVMQDKQTAVFSGNVEAVQGNIEIKSDVMTVYYKSGDDKKDTSPNSVSKVEAAGKVRLKTPQESASGSKGIFDVEKNVVTLSGNVSLISGKNVVKGDKFIYNLKTGKSSIASESSNKPTDAAKKKERVRGIFIPGE